MTNPAADCPYLTAVSDAAASAPLRRDQHRVRRRQRRGPRRARRASQGHQSRQRPQPARPTEQTTALLSYATKAESIASPDHANLGVLLIGDVLEVQRHEYTRVGPSIHS